MDARLTSRAPLIAALCALCAGAGGGLLADDQAQVVRVRILTPRILKGKDVDEGKVEQLAKGLQKLPSVKIIPHSDATPHFLIEFDTNKVELGELAKAIASVGPGEAKEEPAAFLMVRAKLDKGQQDAILQALAKLKGVDAKRSRASGDRLEIALDNGGGAKFSEVTEALKSALPKK